MVPTLFQWRCYCAHQETGVRVTVVDGGIISRSPKILSNELRGLEKTDVIEGLEEGKERSLAASNVSYKSY